MKKIIEQMYLSYANDFLTLARFAEFNGISKERAIKIITLGRKINGCKYQGFLSSLRRNK